MDGCATKLEELKALLNLLTEYGVTEYSSGNLFLKLGAGNPVVAPQEDDFDPKQAFDELLKKDLPTNDSIYDNKALWADGQKPSFTAPKVDND